MLTLAAGDHTPKPTAAKDTTMPQNEPGRPAASQRPAPGRTPPPSGRQELERANVHVISASGRRTATWAPDQAPTPNRQLAS